MTWRSWRAATEIALYGPGGFYHRPEGGPGAHFRTSSTASPAFAAAVVRLLEAVDESLGRPDPLCFVEVAAARGALLVAVGRLAPEGLRRRLRLVGVERAERPPGLPDWVAWAQEPPAVTGLLFANEWLDNVPVDVVELADDGVRQVEVALPPPPTPPTAAKIAAVPTAPTAAKITAAPAAPAARSLRRRTPVPAAPAAKITAGAAAGPAAAGVEAPGAERLGPPVSPADAAWLARWWPLAEVGDRAEVGAPRDEAWAAAVARVERGLAVAVDYGHVLAERAAGAYPSGTLTGYREGRQVRPVPDGSCDLTAHVALDAVAAAGATAGAATTRLTDQRTALRALGVAGVRPAYDPDDPAGWLRGLQAAGEAAELVARGGLGDFGWVVHGVRVEVPAALVGR